MYWESILTEDQSLLRVIHEEDELVLGPPVPNDIVWYRQAWYSSLKGEWMNPSCPNCQHLTTSHDGKGCKEYNQLADVHVGNNCLKRTVEQCICTLDQSDIHYNLVLHAKNRHLAELKSKAVPPIVNIEEAIKLATLRDLEIGHRPYQDCCEPHNQEYNGKGRLPHDRIQFKVNSEGVAYGPEPPMLPKAPSEYPKNVGYEDSGYGDL